MGSGWRLGGIPCSSDGPLQREEQREADKVLRQKAIFMDDVFVVTKVLRAVTKVLRKDARPGP